MSIFKRKYKAVVTLLLALLIGFSTVTTAFATQPEPDTALNENNLQKLSSVSAEKIKDGVKFNLGNYTGYIHLLSPDMVKVSILPNGQQEKNTPAIQKTDWATPQFDAKEKNGQYTIKTSKISVVVNEKPFGIKILDDKGNVITEDYMKNGATSGYENGKPYVFKKTDKNENFYGFGEQTESTLNKRGTSMGMYNTDAYAYDNNTKYVYTDIPFFMGLKDGKAYGMLFDNSYRSYYNMAKESDDYYYFYANGGTLTYYFMYGPDISHILDQYTQLTGKMNLPSEWSLGLQQSAWGYTPDQIDNVASTYRAKNIPLDTMNFDIDYMNGYRVFTFNNAYKSALDKLKAMPGFHAVTINDPGVKQDTNYSIFNQGTANDYWVKNANGSTFIGPVWAGDSAFPNFLKSDVRNWWSTNIASSLLNSGVDGIWNDMNEPAVFNNDPGFDHTMPLDAFGLDDNNNKTTSAEFHNMYGHFEDLATYNAWAANNSNKRPFVLTRDMYAGTQRYAAIWTGDSVSDWEHLQMSLPMNMNLGLSGASFVGNDIGGFAGEATPELFARWIELGSFLPFSRIHYDGVSDRNYTQEPWSFGTNVENISKKYIDMRYQLLPYLYNAFNNSAKTGAPVQQPLVYQFQKDPNTYNISDQFMFGDSMMVAPVVEQGKTSRTVYLPQGQTWVNFWDNKEYKGGQTITIDAPLDYMPIFIKKDSIIPTRDVQQYTGEKPLTNLILNTYLDNKANYSFYEDDGKTLDHNNGKYNVTNFDVKQAGNEIEFSQDKVKQNYNSSLQQYTLKLNNVNNPSKVEAANEKYTSVQSIDAMNNTNRSYFYDSNSKTLYVHIPVDENHKVKIHQ